MHAEEKTRAVDESAPPACGGAQVAIEDVVIWTAHISEGDALVEHVLGMNEGEVIVAEVDGVKGCWEKMKDNKKTDEPVNGLKAHNEETKTHWLSLYNERKDEKVSIRLFTVEQLLAEFSQGDTEARDGLLRARAEVENIRRRSQNEINAARKFAIESFAKELLGVRDSLDRAAAVTLDSDAAEPVAQMKKGLGLTLEQFDSALARFAVVEVAAAPGAPFDPECHQAISTAASDEIAPDHIISVVQKGFLLKERLLRPAMVVVAKA